MKLYQLGKGVYNYYCNRVKGNKGLSHNMVQRKLTRNTIAALKVEVKEDEYDYIYVYGKLHIFTKGDKIVKLINSKANTNWFYKDHKLISSLNRKLGIKNEPIEWKEIGNNSHINDKYIKGFETIKHKIS